jgi:hypothetical protein
MKAEPQHLNDALRELLKPLVRSLIDQHGYSCLQFEDLLRDLYVQVAKGKKPKVTKSEVAVKTGLNRKEIQKRWIENKPEPAQDKKVNRAIRVMSGWMRDEQYQNGDTPLKSIAIDGPAPSLEDLIQRYAGDMPVVSVKKELIRSGYLSECGDQQIRWIGEGYAISEDQQNGWAILGSDSAHLLETITHNLEQNKQPKRFQRKVSYPNIDPESIPQLQKEMS